MRGCLTLGSAELLSSSKQLSFNLDLSSQITILHRYPSEIDFNLFYILTFHCTMSCFPSQRNSLFFLVILKSVLNINNSYLFWIYIFICFIFFCWWKKISSILWQIIITSFYATAVLPCWNILFVFLSWISLWMWSLGRGNLTVSIFSLRTAELQMLVEM